MIDRDKNQTDEYKEANSKVVTVGGKKKLLLMDDEEQSNAEAEQELQEIIEAMVAEALDIPMEGCGCGEKEEEDDDSDTSRQLFREGYIDEANFPEGFSIEEFKSLPSFKKRVKYAKEHLERVAGGSGRVVFVADNDTVIKIALNKKGQAQNRVEFEISNMGYPIVTKVTEADTEGYLYLEVERARKLKKSDWKKLTGWSYGEWMSTLNNYIETVIQRKRGRFLLPDDYEDIEETDLFQNLVSLIADYNMPPGDFLRPSSWGIISRSGTDMPVLVDYGLTNQVLETYYS